MNSTIPAARRPNSPAVGVILAAASLLLTTAGCAQGGTFHSAAPVPGPSVSVSASPAGPGSSPSVSPGVWRLLPPISLPQAPYTAVWTGTEFLLHAPSFDDPENPHGSTDAAYNPITNSWRQLSSSPYPGRLVEGGNHAVWTGTEMLAFGELDAALNPATNTWRPLAAGMGGPSVTVWTGRQVIEWGGGCCGSSTADGYAYDPATDRWTKLPASPLAPRHAGGVWTGTELVIAGGWGSDVSFTPFADAAAYNPTTQTWRTLPSLPHAVYDGTITWTGTEVLMVGGNSSTAFMSTADALAYSPVTNTWRRLASMPIPRSRHVAAWTGSRLLVWGGNTTPYNAVTGQFTAPPRGYSYDPATNIWSAMTASPLTARTGPLTCWTGTEMLVWGGQPVRGLGLATDGAAYRPGR